MYERNRCKKKNGKSCKVDERYRYRITQLLLCLAVFLAVFIGKRALPAQMAEAGQRMLAVIRSDTDFRDAFASLGKSLSQHDSVLGELGEFCIEVFGVPSQDQQTIPTEIATQVMRTGLFQIGVDQNQLTASFLRMDELPEELKIHEAVPPEKEDPTPEPELEPEPEPEPEPLQVGDVVEAVRITGEPLPENYTLQWLYLGDMETATPIKGRITSEFGYRDHPTIGRHAPHGGVDIGANTGDTVRCFADGTVEYVGENSDYGLYLRVKHANGVSSFYAHCNKICVKKGQKVKVGEKIAEVGSTGQATGPHLHFEIKLNDTRLNPLYYIESAKTV